MTRAGQAISYQDIHNQNRADGFKVVAPTIGPGDTLLQGRFFALTLRSGLRLHATDTVDMHDLVTQAGSTPGLTIGLFLQGGARVSLGGRGFALGQGERAPHAFALHCAEPDLFERRGVRGQRVRKVNINVPQGWLEGESWADAGALRGLCDDHLSSRTWHPGRRHQELAARLLDPAPDMPFLESLYRESLALEFVGEALRHWGEAPKAPLRLNGRDLLRLRRACDYIDAHQECRLHVDEVAREAGMSVSALQRLFHAAHGASVLEFARLRRLDRAREALTHDRVSVTEAALAAGYSSPANFATAFKRQFGISPKDVRKQR